MDYDVFDEENPWGQFVRELYPLIWENEGAAIVGITGFFSRRKKEDEALRVYLNGGQIIRIPLNEGILVFSSGEYSNYFDNDERERVKAIEDDVNKDLRDGKTEQVKNLLKEYISLMGIGTCKKFKNKKDSDKERAYQTKLFKKSSDLSSDSLGKFILFDMEFQSVWEMNYENEEERDRWINNYNAKNKTKRKRAHCGKPDLVAVHNERITLIELKTNKGALDGKAGVDDHVNDITEMIRINNNNHKLAEELKFRLEVAYKCGIIRTEDTQTIEDLLSKAPSEIVIEKKLLLCINRDLSQEYCEERFPGELIYQED